MTNLWHHDAPRVIGHRGGRGGDFPAENTIEAFAMAHAQGARAIELDARTCGDGDVIVFHDDTLERMSDGADSRAVGSVPYAELRRLDLGGGARIPLLSDALAWAKAASVAVNVELKHDVPSRPRLLRAAIDLLAPHRDSVLVSSFDPMLLAGCRALASHLPRALLTYTGQSYARALHAVARAPMLFAIHIEDTAASDALVATFKQRGLRVGVWTVNRREDAQRLFASGADYVISDCPGELDGGPPQTISST